MKIRYILLISLIINLFSGCTEKNDIANDLEKKRLNQQNTNSLSETHPNADRQKKNRIVVEHCNGIANCVCDSLRDIASYDYKGEKIFCNRKKVLKTAVPPSPNERGVRKILPILEDSHNRCKGEPKYNECFCKKSNFSGSIIIGEIKYVCR